MARHDGTARREGEAVLRQLLLAFEGDRPPAWAVRRVAEGSAVGMTVFRLSNVRGAGQVRELTAELAAAAPDHLPLLIAADQEGGQLVGPGSGSTEFPGAMALGAAGDPALTEQIGRATGLELRALGVTVCYAPVCDLALTPRNVSMGTRSFGSRVEEVAEQSE
jgi:beta-N-acetylhexosaminidase